MAKSDLLPSRCPSLYFIKSGNYVKIGKAVDVNHRLQNLQTGNPLPLQLLCRFPHNGWQEKVWHYAFQMKQESREWFMLDDELKEAILLITEGEEWFNCLRSPDGNIPADDWVEDVRNYYDHMEGLHCCDPELCAPTTNAVPPIVPLCSRKQDDNGPLSQPVGKTDNAAILSELARVKAVFQLRAICAAMGV